MSGSLNNNIIGAFRAQFEKNCVGLLLGSHDDLLKFGTGFRDSDENTITVQLIGYMKKNPISTDYKIDITREQYIDSSATYAGLEDPDTSPRIDIRLMTWTSPEKFEYFFEAKNLYENDFTKSGNKTPVNSKKYQQRYINTGIQHYIDGRYPQGCLVGYVLEGNLDKIVDKINSLLKLAGRSSERLKMKTALGKTRSCYLSTHTAKAMSELTHYFLSFS